MEVGVACIAPYSGAESGCHDVPLPSRSIGTTRSVAPFIVIPAMFVPPPCCMFIPGAIDALGAGDAGPMCIPGAMELIAGAGVGVAGAGVGDAFLAGAVVGIGIPGMGAIVGCAASPGDMVMRVKTAATLMRMGSKRTSR